jgi:butyrate kinase
MNLEMKTSGSRRIMRHLLSQKAAEQADKERKKLLVLRPTVTSTKIAYFEGIEKIQETDIHLSPDINDDVDTRVASIVSWLQEKGLDIKMLDGIACRSGFFQPVPTGVYRIVPEIVDDLINPYVEHISNISIPITMKLAEMSGRGNEMLLTTSDPSVSDEIETVERITGFIKIKRDGTGVHYLSHKAVLKVISSILGRSQDEINVIVAHLGNGISVVLMRDGKILSTVNAFSGVPASSRCGQLDLMRVIDGLKNDTISFRDFLLTENLWT